MGGAPVLGFPQRGGIGEELLICCLLHFQLFLNHDPRLVNQLQRFRIGIAIGFLQKLLITGDDGVQNFCTVGRNLPPETKINDFIRRAYTRLRGVPGDHQGVDDVRCQLLFAPPLGLRSEHRASQPIRYFSSQPPLVLKLLEAVEIALLDGPSNHAPARYEEDVG